MIRRPWMTMWLSTLCLAVGTATARAQDVSWPQWRGHNRDGKSAEHGLLQQWPEGGPPLAWRADGIGIGMSSLSISQGHAFTMGDKGDKQYAVAVRLEDGAIVWEAEVGAANDGAVRGPRSTPTVDEGRLYLVNTAGVLVCLDADSGEERWRKDLAGDFGASVGLAQGTHSWEFSESPLVDGDRVIVTPGRPDAGLVAFHKRTGELIWRASIPQLGELGLDGVGYSSAVISRGGGIKHYVQLIGKGLIGVEAETGRFLWGYNRIANDVANIATPIIQEDYVFSSTGYQTGAALLKLHRDGDGIRAEEIYFADHTVMQNTHGGLILHEGYVYTGTGHNKGFPLSMNFATGEVAWGPVRNEGAGSAAIAYADGRLYFRYEQGLMILVEATPEAYREHGSFPIPGATVRSWSHPIIAGGHLYLREQNTLLCYDVRASD